MQKITTVGQLRRLLVPYKDGDLLEINQEDSDLVDVERKKSDNSKFLQFRAILMIQKK